MKQKRFFVTIGILLAVSTFIVATNYSEINAGECRIVRINSMATWQEYGLGLEPEIIRITKGTCLIWYNRSVSNVKILFEDGKKCIDVVDAASEFMMDGKNCFISKTHVAHGDTASLVFQKEGAYEYLIDIEGVKDNLKGKIYVR
jgi:plastocyanin